MYFWPWWNVVGAMRDVGVELLWLFGARDRKRNDGDAGAAGGGRIERGLRRQSGRRRCELQQRNHRASRLRYSRVGQISWARRTNSCSLFLQLLALLTILRRYDQGADGLLSTVIRDIASTLFPGSNFYPSCDRQQCALGVSPDLNTAVVAISQASDIPVHASRAPEGIRAPCHQVPDSSPSAAMSNAALGTDSCVAINSNGASSPSCTTYAL
jgi:hypothetical protein